jgi:NADH dehydrogenase
MTDPATHSQVVVVGGGFGGRYAAKELARHGVEVTLIDTNGYQTFQPMLYQAATGITAVDDIKYPLTDVPKVKALTDTVASIDFDNSTVTLASGSTVTAEYIVIATGASVNFFGTPGAAQYALPLYTVDDAVRIGQRGFELLKSKSAFSIAVVGAGATGIEISGAMIDTLYDLYPRTFPGFKREDVTVHIIDRGEAPLAHMSESSQQYAHEVLTKAEVNFHLGRGVTEVTATAVTLDDGSTLDADMTIWAGGLTVRLPSLQPMPDADKHGRVLIDPDLRITGQPRAYCIGDVSADRNNALPQLGSVAKQQGLAVSHAIRRQLKGEEPKPFKYEDMGTMAMIRHDAATVDIGSSSHTVNGAVAFTMWLGLHAYLLPGEEHRLQAVRSWAYETMTGKSKYLPMQ